jgi:uncharacterized protein (TIGR02757 family)
MELPEIKLLLDQKSNEYNREAFILDDPIQVPHYFSAKEDQEITGFLTSLISWGKRELIIPSAFRMFRMMGDDPYQFVMHAGSEDIKSLHHFTYRTFQKSDLPEMVILLRRLYENEGMESTFSKAFDQSEDAMDAIGKFRKVFLSYPHSKRLEKHISDPTRGSAAKRINMFLRWMVRKDRRGVDLGLWKEIDMGKLCIPLDVHTARVSRALGLLKRRSNDARAVQELTQILSEFRPEDPVYYDYALFGLSKFDGLSSDSSFD